jgi:hypothetical protein
MSLLEHQFSELERELRQIFKGSLRETKPISRTTKQIKEPDSKLYTDLTFMTSPENITFGIQNIKAYSIDKLGLQDPLSGNMGVTISSICDKVKFTFNHLNRFVEQQQVYFETSWFKQ